MLRTCRLAAHLHHLVAQDMQQACAVARHLAMRYQRWGMKHVPAIIRLLVGPLLLPSIAIWPPLLGPIVVWGPLLPPIAVWGPMLASIAIWAPLLPPIVLPSSAAAIGPITGLCRLLWKRRLPIWRRRPWRRRRSCCCISCRAAAIWRWWRWLLAAFRAVWRQGRRGGASGRRWGVGAVVRIVAGSIVAPWVRIMRPVLLLLGCVVAILQGCARG